MKEEMGRTCRENIDHVGARARNVTELGHDLVGDLDERIILLLDLVATDEYVSARDMSADQPETH